MTTQKHRMLTQEVDGVEQSFPQELDMATSDMLLGVRGLVTLPTTQATSASTLTLTATSDMVQYFTGTTAGQIIKLPAATTVTVGHRFEFYNQSSQGIIVQDASGAVLFTLSQTSIGYIILQTGGTAGGGWISWQVFVSSQASGILNYQVVASASFASASATDVVITGFTVTPQAGTYGIWFNIATQNSSGTATNTASIYRGGVQIADSERAARMAASNSPYALASITVAAFTGAQACDVRVKCSSATQTVLARTLLLVRLGS